MTYRTNVTSASTIIKDSSDEELVSIINETIDKSSDAQDNVHANALARVRELSANAVGLDRNHSGVSTPRNMDRETMHPRDCPPPSPPCAELCPSRLPIPVPKKPKKAKKAKIIKVKTILS